MMVSVGLLGLLSACQRILNLILWIYLLIELLPNDVIIRVQAFVSEESKELMNGQVLRVLIFQVSLLSFLHSFYVRICIYYSFLNFKYPPMMMIKRQASGTMTYSGVTFVLLDYFAQAFNIRSNIT